jgi:hypothetical protein
MMTSADAKERFREEMVRYENTDALVILTQLETDLETVRTGIENALQAIVDGYASTSLKERLENLEMERGRLIGEIARVQESMVDNRSSKEWDENFQAYSLGVGDWLEAAIHGDPKAIDRVRQALKPGIVIRDTPDGFVADLPGGMSLGLRSTDTRYGPFFTDVRPNPYPGKGQVPAGTAGPPPRTNY